VACHQSSGSCSAQPARGVLSAYRACARASTDENPDLYWAIRGGGGNFGVVTSFKFRLHEIGTVIGGPTFWPVEAAAEVLSVYRHHGESGTARNALSRRDWFDLPWLLEGLLAIPELTPDERARLVALRRAALRRAGRAQVGRLARGRLTTELPRYLAYRTRASLGKGPLLAPALLS